MQIYTYDCEYDAGKLNERYPPHHRRGTKKFVKD